MDRRESRREFIRRGRTRSASRCDGSRRGSRGNATLRRQRSPSYSFQRDHSRQRGGREGIYGNFERRRSDPNRSRNESETRKRRRGRHRRHDSSSEYSPQPRRRRRQSPAEVSVEGDESTSPSCRRPSDDRDDSAGRFLGGPGAVIAGRYKVVQEVGLGTFGRVLECQDLQTRRRDRSDRVAIKVVRKVARYYDSAVIEARIIQDINRRGGRGLSHFVVMHDAFSFAGHYSLVFECLGPSLYDFLKKHSYRPFPMTCIQDFSVQLLEALEFIHAFRLCHTDLKIENVLLVSGREVLYRNRPVPASTRIKIIDFGGASYDTDKKARVINTRQYRAPEVVLDTAWSMPSDMWSLGCILVELYQGDLLFPTHDDVEHLALMEKVISPFPEWMLRTSASRNSSREALVRRAFNSNNWHRLESVLSRESVSFVRNARTLESIVRDPEDSWFLNLLRRILVIDPQDRATAHESLKFLRHIGRDDVRHA